MGGGTMTTALEANVRGFDDLIGTRYVRITIGFTTFDIDPDGEECVECDMVISDCDGE